MIDERTILDALKTDITEELEALHQRGYPLAPREIETAKSRVWWKYKKIGLTPMLESFPIVSLLCTATAELEAEGKLDRFRQPCGGAA